MPTKSAEFYENIGDPSPVDSTHVDNLMKNIVDQNVSKSVFPNNGKRADETKVGNSAYIFSDDAEIKWYKKRTIFLHG